MVEEDNFGFAQLPFRILNEVRFKTIGDLDSAQSPGIKQKRRSIDRRFFTSIIFSFDSFAVPAVAFACLPNAA